MRFSRVVRAATLTATAVLAVQVVGPLAAGDATGYAASPRIETGSSTLSASFASPVSSTQTSVTSAAIKSANAAAEDAGTLSLSPAATALRTNTTARQPAVVRTETLLGIAGVGPANLGTGSCMGGTTRCNAAIAFMVAQMKSGANWHSMCLRLVSTAYGNEYSGIPRAVDAANLQKADGKLLTTTDYKSIPRGAVLWFSGGYYGHVAISIGGGMAISSDAPTADGKVGVVPIEFFEKSWHKTFMGYSMA